jgi:transcriptional regulator of nitric oxide reductase
MRRAAFFQRAERFSELVGKPPERKVVKADKSLRFEVIEDFLQKYQTR